MVLPCTVAFVLTLSLLSATACGSESTPTPLQIDLSVEEILSKAAERFESLQSFHFKMTHEGGGTPIALGLEMETVEGDVVSPDRMAVAIEAKASGLFFEVDAIAIGDNTYMTNPFTQKFEDFSDIITPGGFFDPAEGVGSIIANATNPSVFSIETLNGVSVYRLGVQFARKTCNLYQQRPQKGIFLQLSYGLGKRISSYGNSLLTEGSPRRKKMAS